MRHTVKIEISASMSNYWALLTFEDKTGTVHRREVRGDRRATINSNYLQVLIRAVRLLTHPCMIDIYTSSEYVVESFSRDRIVNWEKNGWMNAKRKEIANKEQWQELRKALAPHSVRFLYSERS